MRTWLSLATLPLLPLLCACAEEAEAGTPGAQVQDEVVGVALDQPVIVADTSKGAAPPRPEDGVAGTEGSEGTGGSEDPKATPAGSKTGDDAINELARDILGVDVKGIDELGSSKLVVEEGVTAIAWRDLSLEGEAMEDILDKLLYPDQYDEDEYEFPERITQLDGMEIAIVGYQIPLEWEGTTVPEFMLVGDLLGCCFGGAPMPDQWINVRMKGKGSEYYPYIPVIVRGVLRIEGIEDEAGYAAGCYYIDATSVKKEL